MKQTHLRIHKYRTHHAYRDRDEPTGVAARWRRFGPNGEPADCSANTLTHPQGAVMWCIVFLTSLRFKQTLHRSETPERQHRASALLHACTFHKSACLPAHRDFASLLGFLPSLPGCAACCVMVAYAREHCFRGDTECV